MITMRFPAPTHKNARALTFFNAVLLILLAVLRGVFSSYDDSVVFQDLQDAAGSGGVVIALIFAGIFFAGLIVSGVYLSLPHRVELSKPRQSFFDFYFVAMVWVALFVTVNFLLFFILPLFWALHFGQSALIVAGVLSADAVNLTGIYGMYHYLSGRDYRNGIGFARWCKEALFGENAYRIKKLFLWGIGGYIGFFPVYTIVAVLNYALLNYLGFSLPIQPIVEVSLMNENSAVAVFLFASVVFTAPILEEFLMRGLIFRGLSKHFARVPALIFSGIIFGAFHFNWFSFIPISVLGIFLSWLYFSTGSLVPGMVAHALFNGINFISLEFLQ